MIKDEYSLLDFFALKKNGFTNWIIASASVRQRVNGSVCHFVWNIFFPFSNQNLFLLYRIEMVGGYSLLPLGHICSGVIEIIFSTQKQNILSQNKTPKTSFPPRNLERPKEKKKTSRGISRVKRGKIESIKIWIRRRLSIIFPSWQFHSESLCVFFQETRPYTWLHHVRTVGQEQ